MIILQIEHPVPNFEGWKKAFHSDPMNRKQSGVKHHRIFRQTDDPNNVIIELGFDNSDEAKKMHEALKRLWNQVEGKIITGPKARIIEMVENVQY